MQQPPRRGVTAGSNFLLATLLGIPGLINLVGGVTRGEAGNIICGIAALVYGLLLLRDALHINKAGVPAMPQKQMLLIGFGCLAVYLVGTFLKYR